MSKHEAPMELSVLWRGILAGGWAVVDAYDREGRRYLVARRAKQPRPLSLRERQVLAHAALGRSNKEIAYTLGLAPSTVSSHLRRAMRRVGVGDIATLVRIWAPVAVEDVA